MVIGSQRCWTAEWRREGVKGWSVGGKFQSCKDQEALGTSAQYSEYTNLCSETSQRTEEF